MNKVCIYSVPHSLREEETCGMLRGENNWLIKFSRSLKENQLRPDEEVTFKRKNAFKFICWHISIAWRHLLSTGNGVTSGNRVGRVLAFRDIRPKEIEFAERRYVAAEGPL